jgi:hypothetical protein
MTAYAPIQLRYGGLVFNVVSAQGGIDVGPPSGIAAQDVATLQSALNAGGLIKVWYPGTYVINATLIIRSNTRFILGPNTSIVAVTGGASGTNTFTLLQNANCNSATTAITNMSGTVFNTRSVIMTITFGSAHNLSPGQFVQIKNDPFEVYNGIWLIETVPSGTTLTIKQNCGQNTVAPPTFSNAGQASASQTVATPGVFTAAGNTLVNGEAVTITGTPPGGLATATTYYVVNQATGGGGGTFSLALSPYGAGLQVTSTSACTLVPVSPLGAQADGYISLEGSIGGMINAQFSAQSFVNSATQQDNAIVFRRVLNLLMDGLVLRDGAQGHFPSIQDCEFPVIRNIHYDGPSGGDGPHVFGRSSNPLIENMSGTLADDGAVFQPIDGSAFTFLLYGSGADLGGDIFNPTARNIRIRHGGNSGAVVFYPNGNSNAGGATNGIWRIRGKCLVDGASEQDPLSNNGSGNWDPSPTVAVGNGYVAVASPMDSLECRGVYGNIRINNNGGGVVMPIKEILISGSTGDTVYGDQSQVILDYVSCKSLTVHGMNYTPYTGGGLISPQSSNVTIDSIIYYGCNVEGAPGFTGSPCFFQNGGGAPTIGSITAIGCKFGAGAVYIQQSSFTGTPSIAVIGGYGNGYTALIVCATNTQSFNVVVTGFTSVNPTQAIWNFFGSNVAATAIYTFNITGLATTGTIFVNMTGGTFIINNPDGTMPVDLTLISRQAGSVAKHNGGHAAGTIPTNNLAICDATGAANSWSSISAGAITTY